MKSRAAWSPAWSSESRDAVAAVFASAAALATFTVTAQDGSAARGSVLAGSGIVSDGDPLRALADQCLDGLAEVARLEARTAALKTRLTAEYVGAAAALAPPAASPQERTAQEMALVAEVACVLTVSERAAGALLSESQVLTTALPLTLAALESGGISWQHARIIVDEAAGLDPAGAAALEAHFLDPGAPDPARGCRAGELVASRFRARARAWRERHHPVSIEQRHRKCALDRRIDYMPDRDGMAWLSAYLPADTAAGIWERTTAAARALQSPDETRTLSQLRADVGATWLLTSGTADSGTADSATGPSGGAGDGAVVARGVPSPRAQVLITVPAMALLGATQEPATLDGYGPIPSSMARRLIADGADSFYRVLTDPRDGAPLEIGRTSYRIPKALRQWLRLRDGKCPFPGCNSPSLDNEADHLLAWADGGTTGITNLGQPCRKHHRLKHASAWTPTAAGSNHPPGWISPSGRYYASEHQDWEPPHLPRFITGTDFQPGQGRATDPGHKGAPQAFPEEESGRDPDLELPPDPLPDWYAFTVWREFPAAEAADPDWSAAVETTLVGCLLQPV